mgnify:CR=1 FL=1
MQRALLLSGITHIFVAQGTYRPDQYCNANGAPQQSNDRTRSFVVPPGVRLVGGFRGYAGGVGDPSERKVPTYPEELASYCQAPPVDPPIACETILTGEIGDSEIVTDNSYLVVRCTTAEAPAGSPAPLIDGVTITAGFANTATENGSCTIQPLPGGGAGVLAVDRDIVLRNCRLTEHTRTPALPCVYSVPRRTR